MSDPEPPVNLAAVRAQRKNAADVKAFENGEAFCFHNLVVTDHSTGIIEGDMPICVMWAPGSLEGFRMTRESARQLVKALTELELSPHAPWNGGKPFEEEL